MPTNRNEFLRQASTTPGMMGAGADGGQSAPQRSSFRDPDGQLHLIGDRVLRAVRPEASVSFARFLDQAFVASWIERGLFVSSTRVDSELPDLEGSVVYEHPRIPFPSYASEWPPELLYLAADLTLTLAEEAIEHGYGLKDATPSNVLFVGAKPIFIDALSFEERDPQDPIWVPAGQFERTFLIPLLGWKFLGLAPNELLASHRDGVSPEEAEKWFRGYAHYDRSVMSIVNFPARMARRASTRAASGGEARKVQPDAAKFVLRATMRRLRKALARVSPANVGSRWRDYMQTHSYDSKSFGEKERFVQEALDEIRPQTLLDVGTNTGHFSFMASKAGAQVVAIDTDLPALNEVCARATKDKSNVLPLAVDLTRPTPAVGWANSENASFLERAENGFDLTLFLAVIHHMHVTERVPMDEILRISRFLTRGYAVIEYISPQDVMFEAISTGRRHLFKDLSEATFEAAAKQHFEIVRTLPVNNGSRRLYLLKAI